MPSSRRLFVALASLAVSGCSFGISPGCEEDPTANGFGGDGATSSTFATGAGGVAIDPGFERATFSVCVEAALDPSAIEPPVTWEACANGVAGCERATLADVDAGDPNAHFQTATITAASATMIAARRDLSNFEGTKTSRRVNLYNAASGVARLSFRALDPFCGIDGVALSESRAWLAISGIGDEDRLVSGTLDDLATSPRIESHQTFGAALDATDALVLGAEACCSVTAFDVATKTATDLLTTDGAFTTAIHHPVHDVDLASIYTGATPHETYGAIWTPGGASYAKLIDTPFGVSDLASDGTTLVWIQANDTLGADFWTSPFATTAAALVPTNRRPIDFDKALVASRANAGFYALLVADVNASPTELHLYRLSDMRHWKIASPDGDFADLLFVDASHVWFSTSTAAYRQAIADLDAGD